MYSKLFYCFFIGLGLAKEPAVMETHRGTRVASAGLGSAAYPEWAHHHWVWLPNHVETQERELDFVNGFLSRDIPVGAVNIDSTWSTGVNNFVWDTKKFPDAKKMVDHYHSKNIRVICWATSMVDENSPNYKEGFDKGYYLNGGLVAKWWHGWGSFVDYTNPEAVEWWHRQMDLVLDIGLDGWKNDGTDAILFEWGGFAFGKGDRLITEREYADMYYGDFFNYTRTKNPSSLIMSRPVDSWHEIYLSFSPHYVMFSGWVGDQDPTFSGMQDALRNMFHSAWRNYLNFGSDTGGYRDGTRTKELFIRWSQLSTFTPLFENGGEGNHGPWEYDNETVTIYRHFVNIHMELNPYFLSTGTKRFAAGKSSIWPQASDTIFTPDSWNFLLGDDIFVCPMVESGTTRKVTLPAESDWVDFFTNKTYPGGSTNTFNVPLDSAVAFRKKGSIVPLQIQSQYSMWGGEADFDALTLLVSYIAPSATYTDVYRYEQSGVSVSYEKRGPSQLRLVATPHDQALVFLLEGVATTSSTSAFNQVTEEALLQTDGGRAIGWSTRQTVGHHFVALRLPPSSTGHVVDFDGLVFF